MLEREIPTERLSSSRKKNEIKFFVTWIRGPKKCPKNGKNIGIWVHTWVKIRSKVILPYSLIDFVF